MTISSYEEGGGDVSAPHVWRPGAARRYAGWMAGCFVGALSMIVLGSCLPGGEGPRLWLATLILFACALTGFAFCQCRWENAVLAAERAGVVARHGSGT